MGLGDIMGGVLGSSESFSGVQDPYLARSEQALWEQYLEANRAPTYQKEGEAAMGEYDKSVDEMVGLGRSIGDFSPGSRGAADFEMRYRPALDRLNADYETQDQQLSNADNERGIIGGTPSAYGRSLRSREYARELSNAEKEAMAAAEGQRLEEYKARSSTEPALHAGKIVNQGNVQGNILNKNAAAQNAAATLNAGALKNTGINTEAATAMRLGNQKTSSNLMGAGIGAAAGALAFMSDRRLKRNIRRIGTLPNGLGWYKFDIFGRSMEGVMADEVEKILPEAVITLPKSGYKMVDYGRIHV